MQSAKFFPDLSRGVRTYQPQLSSRNLRDLDAFLDFHVIWAQLGMLACVAWLYVREPLPDRDDAKVVGHFLFGPLIVFFFADMSWNCVSRLFVPTSFRGVVAATLVVWLGGTACCIFVYGNRDDAVVYLMLASPTLYLAYLGFVTRNEVVLYQDDAGELLRDTPW